MFWLAAILIPIFVMDFKYLILPDIITIGGILVGFSLSFFEGGIGWANSIIGIVVCGGGLYLAKRWGIGFGDVKLFAGFGAIMGGKLAYIALAMGLLLVLITVFPFRFFAKKNMLSPIPFGPFLGLAAFISLTFSYKFSIFVNPIE
ncbi:MAG: A24 family peptidase [Fibromonadaceae bacterium]|nr:A24 family peptidase [Fibromonadaceae bacterium]